MIWFGNTGNFKGVGSIPAGRQCIVEFFSTVFGFDDNFKGRNLTSPQEAQKTKTFHVPDMFLTRV